MAGTGDGILAHTGSGCDQPSRVSVTLGTSSSVRQVLSRPVLNEAAGTFCYRASRGAFLLGCASSNSGGNVLDWARSVLGELPVHCSDRTDLPTFIPLLNGERSPEWDETLTASWHGVKPSHTAADLASAVLDGVVFNLAHYCRNSRYGHPVNRLAKSSCREAARNAVAAVILASVMESQVLRPRTQGLASLRGAAVCGFQALGIESRPALEQIVAESELIDKSNHSAAIRHRYDRYRQIRARSLM